MRLSHLLEGIKVYHGSRSNHGRFSIGHTGHNSHTFGEFTSTRYGVFFTTNKKVAELYGNVDRYELSVTPKEIADLDNTNIIWHFVHTFLHDSESDLYNEARYLAHTWQYFEDDVGKEFHQYLKDQGYKAAVFEEEIPDDDGNPLSSKTFVLLDLHYVRRNPDPKQPDLFLK